jgi:hypothetical protein
MWLSKEEKPWNGFDLGVGSKEGVDAGDVGSPWTRYKAWRGSEGCSLEEPRRLLCEREKGLLKRLKVTEVSSSFYTRNGLC